MTRDDCVVRWSDARRLCSKAKLLAASWRPTVSLIYTWSRDKHIIQPVSRYFTWSCHQQVADSWSKGHLVECVKMGLSELIMMLKWFKCVQWLYPSKAGWMCQLGLYKLITMLKCFNMSHDFIPPKQATQKRLQTVVRVHLAQQWIFWKVAPIT